MRITWVNFGRSDSAEVIRIFHTFSFRTKSHYDFFSASEMADAVLTVEDKDFHVSKQVRDAKILFIANIEHDQLLKITKSTEPIEMLVVQFVELNTIEQWKKIVSKRKYQQLITERIAFLVACCAILLLSRSIFQQIQRTWWRKDSSSWHICKGNWHGSHTLSLEF